LKEKPNRSTLKILIVITSIEKDSTEVDYMPNVTIDYDTCILCQTCVSICPMGVYVVEDEKVVATNEGDCIVCRACEASCPVEAITVEE
jgi:NAD-dependent dihydropyrimidine dehydrogenase PreA subunit